MNTLRKTSTGYDVVIDGDIVATVRKFGRAWDWTWSDSTVPSSSYETLRQVREYMNYRFPVVEVFGFNSQTEFDAAVDKWNAEHANESNPFLDEIARKG